MKLACGVRIRHLGPVALVSLALILGSAGHLQAQPLFGGMGWGARMIITPVITAHGGFYGLCDRRAAKGAAWGVNQVERVIRITAAQRPAYDQLLAAVVEAADLNNGTCPAAIPTASDERLRFLEQRLESLRRAVATVRPAFDNFYGLLTEEQKTRLNSNALQRWLPPRRPTS